MAAARAAQAKADRRAKVLRVLNVAVVVILFAGLLWWLAGIGNDDGDHTDSTESTETTVPDSTTAPVEAPVALPVGPDGRELTGDTPCPATDGSEKRVKSFEQAPPMCIEKGERLVANIETDAGVIKVQLDTTNSPIMTNNFVVLARYGFYDGIPFHRFVPDFVVQVGGSGAADDGGKPDYGTTGPGYDLSDVEYPKDGYKVGSVAMARSAKVSGSQFFIVTGEPSLSALNSNGTYPMLGTVTEGLNIAVAMANQGGLNGAPTVLHTIKSITIV